MYTSTHVPTVVAPLLSGVCSPDPAMLDLSTLGTMLLASLKNKRCNAVSLQPYSSIGVSDMT